MKAIINGNEYRVTLMDNALSSSFAAMLPLEMELSRSGGHEYYAALLKTLDTDGARLVSKVKNNGLYYFKAWNALSLNFKDMDISPYEVHELGTIEGAADVLEKSSTKLTVKFE